MRVAIIAPQLDADEVRPEWTDAQAAAYQNVILAQAATMLKANGHNVSWLLWESSSAGEAGLVRRLAGEQFKLVVILAITSKIYGAWSLIDKMKQFSVKARPKIALVGAHASALPEESFNNCGADYVLLGGDFDFLLTSLCARLHDVDRRSATRLEPGILSKQRGEIKTSGQWRPEHNLTLPPFIDRELTGLFPGLANNAPTRLNRCAAIYTSRDCWWARCRNCARKVLSPPGSYRVRSPEAVLNEIGLLMAKHGVTRIVDTSGSLPTGLWLRRLCQGLIKRGYNRKVRLTCSLKPGSIGRSEATLMVEAGFDTAKVALHSVNQVTLEKLGSNMIASDIEDSLKMWRAAGLRLLVSAELGWPWESSDEAVQTCDWLQRLAGDRLTFSSSIVHAIAFPGTPLLEAANRQGWVQATSWKDFSGNDPVFKSALTTEQLAAISGNIHRSEHARWFPALAYEAIRVRSGQWLWRLRKYRYWRRRPTHGPINLTARADSPLGQPDDTAAGNQRADRP